MLEIVKVGITVKFNIASYLIGEGLGNVFKNKKSTFSALLVMCISMLVFGIFFMIGENVNHVMQTVESSQEIQVFIKNDATEEEIQTIGEQIKAIEGVNKVTYVSKDEALDIMQSKVGEKSYLLAGYEKNNFLPASYKVTLTDLKLAGQVESKINELDNIKKITSSNETMAKLLSIANGIRYVTAAILIALVIGSVFIIANTIKLTVYARRREISIMKYVGATNSFIRWPFIVEGIIIGIVSAGISILIIGGIYKVIAAKLLESTLVQNLNITLVSFGNMFNLIILVYLILGIGIGVLGSSLSMRKYLEV